MNKKSLLAYILLFPLLTLLVACQEEKRAAGQSAPEAATAAPTAESIASQSAPVPEGGALELLLLGPSGRIEKLQQIAAMFNQPMVALGDYDNVPEGAMKVEPPLEGTFKWLNQYTLAFTPKEALEGSAEIRAEVPAGIKALSGASLAVGQTANISLPLLEVRNSDPINRDALDEAAALKPAFTVALNQKVDLASLQERAFFVYQKNGEEIKTAAEVRDATARYSYYGQTYLFTPKSPLPKDTEYQIILEAGVKSLSGPLPSQRLAAFEGRTFGPLTAELEHYTEGNPANGLYINFSNPVKTAEAVRAMRIDNGYDLGGLEERYPLLEAAVREGEENVDGYASYLYIPGGFKPQTTYTVSFDENFTDVFGQKIGQRRALTFTTRAYDTSVDLDDNFGLMETSTEPKAPITLSNIDKAKVMGYALTVPEALRFMAALSPEGYFSRRYRDAMKTLRREPDSVMDIVPPAGSTVNGPRLMPVDLAAMFGEKLVGRLLYLESFWRPGLGSDMRGAFSLLQISDVGLAIKTAPDGGLIWVTNLARGQSWPGARVALYNSAGAEIWRGTSDENGLARLPGSIELLEKSGGDENIFVVGEAEGQMSIWNINWNEGLESWRWNLNTTNALAKAPEKRLWLLSALPLYKPGETAEFKVIAREKNGESVSDLADKTFTLTVEDARGQKVEEREVTTDAYGSFSHKLPLASDAPLGSWNVYLGPAGDYSSYVGNFLVMTYRAPAFEIEVGEPPQKAMAGDKAELSITASYHFGAPVSNQPLSYEVTSGPVYWFTLPGLADFDFVNGFSNADEYDDSGYGYQEPTSTVSSDTTTVDAEGKFTLPLDLTTAPGVKPRPRRYNAYFSVTDVDQRVISTNTSFTAHPADVYVGLKGASFLCTVGEPCNFQSVVADVDGNFVARRPHTFTVYHRQWQNVRRKTPGNTYEYVSRVVDEADAISESPLKAEAPETASYPLNHSFTPTKPGLYWVLSEVEDEKGRKNQASASFYVQGPGPVGWQMSNNDQLTLVADKKEYKPGDMARILVQSPFSEGEGLLTVERGGVRDARVFKIENQTPTLEIPITEEEAPNIFASVLLARGRIADKPDEKGVDLGKPAIRMGYVELKISTKRDMLTVEVTPDKAEVGPGGEVEVDIAVKDHEGKAFAEAEVALIAADAAVVQLAGDEPYYPDRFFMRDEMLAVQTANNLVSLIGRRNWGSKGANPGGGGGDLSGRMGDGNNIRRLFKALAHFDPSLKLDAEGRARATIKMPENLTTFKVYAVATGHGKKSGTGQSEVLVTRDLLARSALPNYAGAGDSFAAAMVVTNRGKNSGEVTVKLTGENFTLAANESAEKTVAVTAGESVEVPFKVQTGAAGKARFIFNLAMGEERDAAEYAIDVIPPNKPRTQASYERLEAGEKRVDLALPAGYDPTRGGLSITVSPSLLGLLSGPFQYLAEYPHRCIEQETSRAYGSLLRLDLAAYLPDGNDEAKLQAARDHVSAHLARLAGWEYGGGFSLWPGNNAWDNRSVYLTAYVFEFMLSARQRGLAPPDEDFENRVTEFLLSALKSDYKWPAWYSEQARNESQSYAIAVLSRAGKNVAAYIEHYYQNRAGLNLTQLVNLIRAIAYQPKGNGQAEQLRELLPHLNKHLSLTGGEAQFVNNTPGARELWYSPTQSAARILDTLCLAAPHNTLVEPLLRNLVSQMRAQGGHFGTTQNNALALNAMASYAKALEAENPNLKIAAILGESAVLETTVTSYIAPAATARQSLAAIKDIPALTYKVEGAGQAWARTALESAPKAPDLSADTNGGFMLSRSFTVVKPEGQEGVESFRRGDVVKVSVTMMVPVPRYSVVLEDRVPAGFEPVNFKLDDADMRLMGFTSGGYWYDHQEIWPDRLAVYADYLRPGVYTFSYLARAITPGQYSTPGPVAEEMYAPETYGRGQGQVLTVE